MTTVATTTAASTGALSPVDAMLAALTGILTDVLARPTTTTAVRWWGPLRDDLLRRSVDVQTGVTVTTLCTGSVLMLWVEA